MCRNIYVISETDSISKTFFLRNKGSAQNCNNNVCCNTSVSEICSIIIVLECFKIMWPADKQIVFELLYVDRTGI
jgi:hypothetical protein